jgi:hypothetical protein
VADYHVHGNEPSYYYYPTVLAFKSRMSFQSPPQNCCCSCRWDEIVPLSYNHQRACFSSHIIHMESWWNDTDRNKPKNSEKSLSQCHFSATNPTGMETGANPGLRGDSPATNLLSHGTACRMLELLRNNILLP